MIELQENLFRVPYLGFYNIKSDHTQDKLVKEQACHLLVEEVEDVSDLENFDSGNAMYRGVITIKINAYIYRKYKNKSIEKFNTSLVNQYGLTIDQFDKTNDDGVGLIYIVDGQKIKSDT